MIRTPVPALILAGLALVLLAARLNVATAADAALWFFELMTLLVALLSRSVGEGSRPGEAPRPPATAGREDGAPASPLPDLRRPRP